MTDLYLFATSGLLSSRLLVSVEMVAVGMIVAVLVFPVQSLFCFLFSKAYSQVSGDDVKLCYSLEILKGTWSLLDLNHLHICNFVVVPG